ncbi:SulP family inorganic anion transporter [Clostridium sp. MCC328]|uniref:SulP family inorganic anion transporter n=1 Tax=Clostridium sp. MCC328 TaxID=2592642 RepID=UPI001C01605B|nr:SulP family inorganic anion transporter [Clostridium sp. MCC328]MBT9822094.1 STAS domain-containing protein [Clostridium sp. MCC328]
MEKIRPMLFTTLKKYSGAQLMSDVVAGIIVAIIALPLSIALALASGVGPEQGIYTAIAAGFVISFLGGSQVQIAGPTAAFATIVAGIVARSGVEGLAVATIMAGIILVIMGFCQLGSLIKFIPFTITTGFTSGIAVTIVIGQLKDFFGVTYPAGMETIETMQKLKAFAAGFGTMNVHALIVGLVCLAILIVMPKITEKIPGSLVAVLVGIVMVKFLPLQVNTIGDLYSVSNALPAFHMPAFSYDVIQGSLSDAFTIAILAAIESLLSCVVADGMIGGKHRSNTELVAQGAGNIVSALFGGIPATGAIARTAANIKNGGRTPVAGMVHAGVLLLILVILMPYASWIPMPTIAAILFMVAYNMCQWRTFARLAKTAPKSDIAVLVITFFLTVVFDLVVAIEVGMVLSCLLFMKRMSDEMGVRSWLHVEEVEEQKREEEEASRGAKRTMSVEEAQLKAAAEEINPAKLRQIPMELAVYELTGPLFFGAADRINQIEVNEVTRCLILRMRAVPAADSTAMNSMTALCERCKKNGVTLIMSHVNEQPMRAMEKAGFVDLVGRENFCRNIEEALDHADKVLEK